jgi:hypothetical protein
MNYEITASENKIALTRKEIAILVNEKEDEPRTCG